MSRARRATALVAALALAPSLSGCETNAERSARLQEFARHHVPARRRGLVVGAQNRDVEVVLAQTLHDQNGTVALVRLRNRSSRALRNLPIAIALSDAHGKTLYENNAPGLDPSLTSVALLAPHGELTWIDDQIQIAGSVAHVRARVGQARSTASARTPRLSVGNIHVFEDPANGVGAEGVLTNHSSVSQQKLVIFAVARRAGRVVAAGRAVLPEAPASTSTPFQVFFIGDPRGARFEADAPATSF